MKFIGFLLALGLFAGVLFGVGYGLIESWGFITHQWTLLDTSWKPVLILLSSLIIFCTLLVILLIRSGFRQTLNSSTGKTSAYNHFMNWYVEADKKNYSDIHLETIQDMRNEFLLWAGNNVLKQFNNLFAELEKENSDVKNIKKYADFIYIEIQRDIGHRGDAKLRQI